MRLQTCLSLSCGRPLALLTVAPVAALIFTLAGCFKSPQQKSAEWLASAKTAMDRKDYGRAIIELQNALQATPKNPEACYMLGRALLEGGEPGRSARYFKLAVELQPGNLEAGLKLVEVLIASGDPAMLPLAEEQAKASLAEHPDDPNLLNVLAVAEWRQNKTQLAVEHLKQAIRTSPANLEASVNLSNIQWTVKHDVLAAELTLRQALSQSSDPVEARLALGRFYALSGKKKEAEAEFRQAIEAKPGSGPALIELAKLLQSSGRPAEAEQTLNRLTSLPDKSYGTAHALYLFENNKKDAAIAELKQLLNREPDDNAARTRLVSFYLQSGKLDEAELQIKSAIGRDARNPDLLEQQTELLVLRQQFSEAEKSINQAVSIRPSSASGHYLRAVVFRRLGRDADYLQELKVALSQNSSLIAARIELSQSFRASKAFREAFEIMDAAPPYQQNELPVLVERSWVLLAQRRFDAAKPDVEKALSISREPATLTLSGILALQEKRNEVGRTLLEECLQSSPENLEALNAIAMSLASEKKVPAAVERVRKQAAQLPKSAALQLALGSWLEQTGDLAGARTAYAAARTADPSNLQVVIASARMEMMKGLWDAAKRDLEAVLSKDPRNLDGLLALGMLEEGSGHQKAAVKAYRTILQADPAHVVAKNNLVVLLSENAAATDEALILAHELKQALPDDPEIDDTLGWVYYKKGSFETAIKYFTGAASRSKNARFKYHLAMAYFRAGNRRLGQNTLSAALELNPNLPEAGEARKLASAP